MQLCRHREQHDGVDRGSSEADQPLAVPGGQQELGGPGEQTDVDGQEPEQVAEGAGADDAVRPARTPGDHHRGGVRQQPVVAVHGDLRP